MITLPNVLRFLARWLLDQVRIVLHPTVRVPPGGHIRAAPPPVEPDCVCDYCTAARRAAR